MTITTEVQIGTGGFVEGISVWAKDGLVPVEMLRPGDRVLSQPEASGVQRYNRVLSTRVREDQIIWHLSYCNPRKRDMGYLYATGSHSFWTKNAGWLALEQLKPGQDLEFSDGTIAVVYKCDVLYRTAEPSVGFITTDYGDKYFGFRVDLDHAFKDVSSDGENLLRHLPLGAPEMRRRTFDIEVEDSQSYYVGSDGLRARGAR